MHAVVFATAVVAGQVACYAVQRITTAGLGVAGVILLGLPALVFAVTTFLPPRLPLFRDALTGGYGISRAGRR